jgi:hypothetical protein
LRIYGTGYAVFVVTVLPACSMCRRWALMSSATFGEGCDATAVVSVLAGATGVARWFEA